MYDPALLFSVESIGFIVCCCLALLIELIGR